MHPDRAAIERQLETIFASADFVSAPKMRSLLRYLVEATLAGDAERLKGYAIGVDVFERGAAFDPGTDPIVRVQAGRLRKLLETYYLTTGQGDPIRIEIPKGGYAVALVEGPAAETARTADTPARSGGRDAIERSAPGYRQGAGHLPLMLLLAAAGLAVLLFLGIRTFYGPSTPEPAALSPAEPDSVADAITLAVLPFTDMSKGASNTYFADGLTDALTTALARVKSVALASRTSAFQYRDAADLRRVGRELGVRYVLEGGLQHDGARMRINVQLIDALSGAHVWAQHYDRPAGDDLAVQSELVTTLAAEIRPQLVNAAKRAMEAGPARPARAWQLYMQSTWMPGAARNSLAWEKERVALATKALDLDPNLGQADSVLADKLAYLANVDPPSDTEEARAKATLHARRAVELAPGDADVLFNVSIHHWHAGHIAEALEATQRTLELDPNHVLARFLVNAVPFTCAPAPPAVLEALTAFDAALSPDNPVRWLTLLWIGRVHLNNNDLEKARDAARRSDQIFRTPDSVYQLAAILVQLGETQEAVAQVDQQRDNWPNLDPRHYADVAVRRRCGTASNADFLHRVYGALADAVDAARRGG
jgi:TolB-like protein